LCFLGQRKTVRRAGLHGQSGPSALSRVALGPNREAGPVMSPATPAWAPPSRRGHAAWASATHAVSVTPFPTLGTCVPAGCELPLVPGGISFAEYSRQARHFLLGKGKVLFPLLSSVNCLAQKAFPRGGPGPGHSPRSSPLCASPFQYGRMVAGATGHPGRPAL
jgi:hypothetical protein